MWKKWKKTDRVDDEILTEETAEDAEQEHKTDTRRKRWCSDWKRPKWWKKINSIRRGEKSKTKREGDDGEAKKNSIIHCFSEISFKFLLCQQFIYIYIYSPIGRGPRRVQSHQTYGVCYKAFARAKINQTHVRWIPFFISSQKASYILFLMLR